MKRTLAGLLASAVAAIMLLAQPLPAAAVTVTIPDIEIRTCVNQQLSHAVTAPITDADLRTLKTFTCWGDFRSISGLEYAINLTSVDLPLGQLSGSLTVPSGWTKLQTLRLWGNALTKVTIPSTLVNLTEIDLDSNALTTFNVPTTLTKLRTIYLSDNAIGNLNQLSWLPSSVQVFADGQVVQLPTWVPTLPYALTSRTRNGRNTTLTLPAGVTRTSAGIDYPKNGSYTIAFNGDSTGDYTTLFNGRYLQTVNGPEPANLKGEHTGDKVADVYGIDSSGNLQFYKGSATTGFTHVTQRGAGWSGISAPARSTT